MLWGVLLADKNEKMNKSKTHFLLSSNFRTPCSTREVLEIGFLAGVGEGTEEREQEEETEQTQSNRECRQLLS